MFDRIPEELRAVSRWHRITECAFESEKPTELAQQEETKVYSGIEDDLPF